MQVLQDDPPAATATDTTATTSFWFTEFAQLDSSGILGDSGAAEAQSPSPFSVHEWSSELRTWHQHQLRALAAEPLPNGRRSRYKKRPATPSNNIVPLPLLELGTFVVHSNNEQQQVARATKKKRPISSGDHDSSSNFQSAASEADACALQYLWQRHGGRQPQAGLTLLADWTRERAIRTVREHKHRARKQNTKSTSASSCWFDLVLESMPVAVPGYLRLKEDDASTDHVDDSSDARAIYAATSSRNNNNDDYDSIMDDWDELPATWDAVLACAHAILEVLPSVHLSSLAHFLHQAAQLPFPEHLPSGPLSEIDTTLQQLADVYLLARRHQNKLLDLWGQDGVDLDLIQKQLAATEQAVAVSLDEMEEMKRQVAVVLEWQNRLETTVYSQFSSTCDDDGSGNVDERRNDLAACEVMLREAGQHGFRGKELVALEQKVERAYALRDRILEWRQSSSPAPDGTGRQRRRPELEPIKFVSSIVRDIHRLKLRFPEASEMLLFNTNAESWVERANIAIRSRISLDEIQTLIARGQEMPLDLSEYLEKLQSRQVQAVEWLDSFHETIARPEKADGSLDRLELMRRIRTELDDGLYNLLHEFATDGSRIPVEVDCVKLLQVELDARVWTIKARKLLPKGEDDGSESSKRGKLEDLREHVSKAATLRDRLVMSSDEKKAWVLDGELELSAIVDAADEWIDEHQWIWGGAQHEEKDCLSVEQLRAIVNAGNAIYANLGNGIMSKMNRMLAQAEKWQDDFNHLLVKCNIRGTAPPAARVEIAELKKAIEAASNDVLLDLTEALQLRNLVKKIEDWFIRASIASGEKRQTRGKKTLFSFSNLQEMIQEACSLPVETAEYVARLQEQSRLVQEWQARASADLEGILVGFQYLREAINETYGPPAEFSRDRSASSDFDESKENVDDGPLAEGEAAMMDYEEEKKSTDDQCDGTVSTATSDQDLNALSHLGSGDCNVQSLIKSFCKDSKMSFIVTPEGLAACQLENVSRWCMRSLRYLENPRDVFDHRFFGAFDRFISEGTELSNESKVTSGTAECPNRSLFERLQKEWGGIVAEQVQRLRVLLDDRKDYIAWCKKAEQLLDIDERRPSLEKLNELAEKSREFPSRSELIQKVRKLAKDASSWSKLASKALASDEKMSMSEGKMLFDQGDKLGFTCPEMKVFRNGLKSARGWSTRVKRCKLEHGTVQHANIVSLLEEHNALVFDMGDEVAQLSQAMKNYCLCRRPYEGFMIGCDTCEDWFHGPCVGLSESRADKVTKYVCLRCSLKKTYTASSFAAVGIIRKWTSVKDKRQARHLDNQKFKRKVRKEKKQIEKFQEQASELRKMLDRALQTEIVGQSPSNGEAAATIDTSASVVAQNVAVTAGPSLPGSCASQPNNDLPKTGGVSFLPAIKSCNPVSGLALERPTTDEKPAQLNINGVSSTADSMPRTVVDVKVETAVDTNIQQVAQPSSTCESSESVEGDGLKLSRTEIQANLDGIARLIQGCVSRLTKIAEEEKKQKELENFEDTKSDLFRSWVVRVRSLVVVPSTRKLGAESKPKCDGSMSDLMKSVLEDANRLGLHNFADVKEMRNHFQCMGWCLRAIEIFARQPTADELTSLVNASKQISFPDEKAVRTLKSMSKRVTVWQNKVIKALSPVPGAAKPYSLDALKELAATGDDIPVCMPLEVRLRSVIEDGGGRYCFCGGPSDGRFMVGCEQCDGWYHGHCVSIDKQTPEEHLDDWKCPKCAGSPTMPLDIAMQVDRFHENFETEIVNDSESEDNEDVSFKAPDPDQLWPPFGFFGSQKASEVLGQECRSIPDITGPLESQPPTSIPTPAVPSQGTAATAKSMKTSLVNPVQVTSRVVGIDGSTSVTIPSASKPTSVFLGANVCAVPAQEPEKPPKVDLSASGPIMPLEMDGSQLKTIATSGTTAPTFTEEHDGDRSAVKEPAQHKTQQPASSSCSLPQQEQSSLNSEPSLTALPAHFASCGTTSTESPVLPACPSASPEFQDLGPEHATARLTSEARNQIVSDPMDTSS